MSRASLRLHLETYPEARLHLEPYPRWVHQRTVLSMRLEVITCVIAPTATLDNHADVNMQKPSALQLQGAGTCYCIHT